MAYVSRLIYLMYGRCVAVFNFNGGHTQLADLEHQKDKVTMKLFSLNTFEAGNHKITKYLFSINVVNETILS